MAQFFTFEPQKKFLKKILKKLETQCQPWQEFGLSIFGHMTPPIFAS
jgi:hypothetical protein